VNKKQKQKNNKFMIIFHINMFKIDINIYFFKQIYTIYLKYVKFLNK
jgi:hypothetical protein